MRIGNVRFIKQSLEQTEWTILEPNCKWNDSKSSQLNFRVGRKSGYYIQNVVLLMASLAALGLMVFFCSIDDIGSRTSISLTLLLTLVAFKFVLASMLPVISYNTFLDYYVIFATYTLVIQTIASIIPFCITEFISDDDGTRVADRVNGYMRYIFAGLIGGGTLIWFIVCQGITKLGSEKNESKEIKFYKKDDSDTHYDYKLKYWVRSSDVRLDESNNQKADSKVIPSSTQLERHEMEPYYYKQGVPIPRSKLVVRKKKNTLF